MDPNGELAFLVPLAILAIKGAIVGAATDAGIELASQLIENGGNIDCVDWGDVGASGVDGGISGGLMGPLGKAVTAAKRFRQAAKVGASLDDLSRAASAADRNGLTRAGRALQKHSGRSGSAFDTSATRAQDLNRAGQDVVDDILTTPGSVEKTNRLGGVDVRAPDGRGLRFNQDGSFRGFLEP